MPHLPRVQNRARVPSGALLQPLWSGPEPPEAKCRAQHRLGIGLHTTQMRLGWQ